MIIYLDIAKLSKLIFFAPFRDGVNEENQFAPLGKEMGLLKI
jgi:hypothetical protein